VYQLDIKNAFLHENLHADVYMLQPLGYEDWRKMDKDCKLKKAIYGLKQFSRAWFDKFSIIAAHYGLRQSSSDHSIFVRYFLSALLFFQFILILLSLEMIIKILLS